MERDEWCVSGTRFMGFYQASPECRHRLRVSFAKKENLKKEGKKKASWGNYFEISKIGRTREVSIAIRGPNREVGTRLSDEAAPENDVNSCGYNFFRTAPNFASTVDPQAGIPCGDPEPIPWTWILRARQSPNARLLVGPVLFRGWMPASSMRSRTRTTRTPRRCGGSST